MQRPMIDAKKARETRMDELSAWRSVEMDYLAGIDYRPSTLLVSSTISPSFIYGLYIDCCSSMFYVMSMVLKPFMGILEFSHGLIYMELLHGTDHGG